MIYNCKHAAFWSEVREVFPCKNSHSAVQVYYPVPEEYHKGDESLLLLSLTRNYFRQSLARSLSPRGEDRAVEKEAGWLGDGNKGDSRSTGFRQEGSKEGEGENESSCDREGHGMV